MEAAVSRTRARSTSELRPRTRWFSERPRPALPVARVGDALGVGKGRRAGTTASPKSITVGTLRFGVETVAGLPDELERPGVDQPVAGDPMGCGWLELGRLKGGVEVRVGVGAGRPLMTEFEPEVRDGVDVRVGV